MAAYLKTLTAGALAAWCTSRMLARAAAAKDNADSLEAAAAHAPDDEDHRPAARARYLR